MSQTRTKKEAILHAAAVFFSEKGFRDTAMKDIARVTGVADGTIFYHFKTKEDLFIAVLKKFKEEIFRELEIYLTVQKQTTGLEMVEGAISFFFHLSHQMEARFLLMHRHYPYQLARNNPDCRQCLEEIYNCFINLFEEAILKGQQDGTIREVAAHKKALIIFTLVDGLARMETYNLYRAGPLYNELIESCRTMLENKAG
ncbi:MAG: TetR/AcrR family transcriptional regulator [Desulfobulbaceae bacterium]|nr:TetR/AcrR family transcriptional regulator [Desulfobulbaceae bacterium]